MDKEVKVCGKRRKTDSDKRATRRERNKRYSQKTSSIQVPVEVTEELRRIGNEEGFSSDRDIISYLISVYNNKAREEHSQISKEFRSHVKDVAVQTDDEPVQRLTQDQEELMQEIDGEKCLPGGADGEMEQTHWLSNDTNQGTSYLKEERKDECVTPGADGSKYYMSQLLTLEGQTFTIKHEVDEDLTGEEQEEDQCTKQDIIKMRSEGNKCFTCNRIFSHYRSLKRHLNEQHGHPRRHSCKECGKTYGRLDNLRAHERKHQRSPRRRSPQASRSPHRSPRSSRYHLEERLPKCVQRHTRQRSRSPRSHSSRNHPDRDQQKRNQIDYKRGRDAERKLSKERAPGARGSEREDDFGDHLVIDVLPTTRNDVEGENRKPLKGKARGMCALLASERRQANSTSEDAEESEGTVVQANDDVLVTNDIRRVQIGQDIGNLDAERVLEGKTVNVCEYSSTSCYGKEGKVFQESKERRYQVTVHQNLNESADQTKGATKIRGVDKAGKVGTSLTDKELEATCVGKVKKINQTVKRETFRYGELIHQEEVVTAYEVDFEAGLLLKDCY
ncbi:sal-like protein 1 [Lytechinus pictus]|uniref:sal-like protein 1 n=1 Tax=Lytechinus pictus TaxID=7653 RepID=UPI0030B9B515